MEKCFCHLNGYAVKDATARAEIDHIKKDIQEVEERHTLEQNELQQRVKTIEETPAPEGMTLNKYLYKVQYSQGDLARLYRIYTQAKGSVSGMAEYFSRHGGVLSGHASSDNYVYFSYISVANSSYKSGYIGSCRLDENGGVSMKESIQIKEDLSLVFGTQHPFSAGYEITYWNDVEIV